MFTRHSAVLKRFLIAFAALLWGGFASPVAAHDIPDEIRLQSFVKADGQTLHVMVRVPLVMLLNLNLPKRGPGFLALDRMDDGLERATTATARDVRFYQGDEQLQYFDVESRIAPQSDESFRDIDAAAAHFAQPPLSTTTQVFWNQGYFDVYYRYPITPGDERVSIDVEMPAGLKNTMSMTLRYLSQDAPERAYQIHYDTGRVTLDPNWYHAAATFTRLGFTHILDGIDHLLFLLLLIAPFRMKQIWSLVAVITSFTVAHSITLSAAVMGWVPQSPLFPALVEVLIAGSILYLAVANVIQTNLQHRWVASAVFGLIHGFGFSFVLQQDLQFAGSHLLLSLASFNVGVELGQLLFVIVALPAINLLLHTEHARRWGIVITSVVVGHVAWHWAEQRYAALRLVPDTADVSASDMVLLGLLLTGVVALTVLLLRRQAGSARNMPPPQQSDAVD